VNQHKISERRSNLAAYISVPRDLTRVKTKVFFGLTKRQLLCFGAAALIGVPSFFLLKSCGNLSLAALGMVIIMLPLFFLAMYEKDGEPLEVIAKHFIQSKFVRPKVRPYQTNNYYTALMRQYDAEKEVIAIVCNAEKRKQKAGAGEAPRKPDKKGTAADKVHRKQRPQG
jgi:hypothetical protein